MSKSKDDGAAKQVLLYLAEQNRPYSVIDIFNNLHKQHGKTTVVRALEQLVLEQKIVEKTYGKQKVYFVNQNDLPDVGDSNVQSMDSEINDLNDLLPKAQQEIKLKESLLSEFGNSLTTVQAMEQLDRIKEEIPLLTERLKVLQSNKPAVNPGECKALQANKVKYHKEWQRKKRVANEILDAVSENYPKGRSELCEEVGVDADDQQVPKV